MAAISSVLPPDGRRVVSPPGFGGWRPRPTTSALLWIGPSTTTRIWPPEASCHSISGGGCAPTSAKSGHTSTDFFYVARPRTPRVSASWRTGAGMAGTPWERQRLHLRRWSQLWSWPARLATHSPGLTRCSYGPATRRTGASSHDLRAYWHKRSTSSAKAEILNASRKYFISEDYCAAPSST